MFALALGALAFGTVIGWMTHRILARKEKGSWSDISTVIATVGGGAVLSLFPAGTTAFAAYAVGLFIGFFGYFAIFLVMARAAKISWLNILTGEGTGRWIMGDDGGGPYDD
jgi:hypothetical protein